MMTHYDDELKNHLNTLLLNNIVQISDTVDELILDIESEYHIGFNGIDWTSHKYIDMVIFSENLIEKQRTIDIFLKKIKKNYPDLLNEKVNVFGDSLTNLNYQMPFKYFIENSNLFFNLPQHTYIWFPQSKLCINSTFEGEIYFG